MFAVPNLKSMKSCPASLTKQPAYDPLGLLLAELADEIPFHLEMMELTIASYLALVLFAYGVVSGAPPGHVKISDKYFSPA